MWMTVTAGTIETTKILPEPTLIFLKKLFETYLDLETSSVTLPDNISSLIETEKEAAIGRIEDVINKKLEKIDSIPFQCVIGLSLYEIIATGRQDKIDGIATLLETISIQESLLEEESEKDYIRSIADEADSMDLVLAIVEAMAVWERILKTMKKSKINPKEYQRIINTGKKIYQRQNPKTSLKAMSIILQKPTNY